MTNDCLLPNQLLGVFARYWEPGQVKTRIAATTNAQFAAEAHLLMLLTTLIRLNETGFERQIVYTPPENVVDFQRLQKSFPTWSTRPQSSGDLGERMHEFFATALATNNRSAVLIGSDSPDLPIEFITDAFRALETKPVVIGPATDGGYYLIGCRILVPDLFRGISWSTDTVFRDSIAKLERLGVEYHLLPEWHDVDNANDFHFAFKDGFDATCVEWLRREFPASQLSWLNESE